MKHDGRVSDADRAKWDRLHAEGAPGAAPAWLDDLDAELPRSGRGLDVAAGRGRLSGWMIARGLDVTAVDISPVGLARCAALGAVTVARDLELDPRLPDGPFDLVACFHYEQAALWPEMVRALAPGGALAAEITTTLNLERHERPSRRFLVEPNALLSRVGSLRVVAYREGWLEGRNVARILAKKIA